MKRIISGFVAGQAVQMALLAVAMNMTYSTSTLWFCGILGAIATILLCVGSGLQSMEAEPPADVEIEEAPPLPEELEVTQTNVTRAQAPKRKTWGSRIADAIEADRKAGGKHEEPSVMEKKLAEVGKE